MDNSYSRFTIIISGMIGVGKSTVARYLFDRFVSAELWISDRVRHEILRVSHLSYQEQQKLITQHGLEQIALSGAGVFLIDSGLWTDQRRKIFRDASLACGRTPVLICVYSSEENILARMSTREYDPHQRQYSRGTPEEYAFYKSQWQDPVFYPFFRIDNNAGREHLFQQCEDFLTTQSWHLV